MFSFLKEKIKSVVKSFTKKTETADADIQTPAVDEQVLSEEIVETIPREEKIVKKEERIKKEEKKSQVPSSKSKEETKKEPEKKKEVLQKPKESREKPKEKLLEKKEQKIVQSPKPQIPISKPQVIIEKHREELKEEKKETVKEVLVPQTKEEPKKEGFFSRITKKFTTTSITQQQFEEFSEHLEIAMLENNVAYEVVEKIKTDLSKALIGTNTPRGSIEETIITTLKQSIRDILNVKQRDIMEESQHKKPYVICFVGVNGSGKTTTIAKIAKKFIDEEKSVVLAGADTFRAAAIEQLQQHADALGIKLIKHEYGSDPAAVAFDAIAHAKQKNKDIVLIDTAGRLHSNTNLIDEMKKIKRVAKPDMTIFIGESITGNDCVEQAQQFNESIGIDGIILTKADVDEKGGAPLSISYVTKKPILYIGTGQEYIDLKEFNVEEMVGKII